MTDAPATVSPSDTPAPTPVPTPTPTPRPAERIDFTANEARPMPSPDEVLTLGKARKLGGTVQSNYALSAVTVRFTCLWADEDPAYPYEKTVTFPAGTVYSYALDSAEGTLEGVSLDSLVKFSELPHAGRHTMTVTATTEGTGKPAELLNVTFDLLSNTWQRVKKADFTRTYAVTSKFFGGKTERFLYRYQRIYGRYLFADLAWEDAYITEFQAYGGRPWKIHIDAVPYYEKAVAYLGTTYVRVSGANGDSGVRVLSDLIETYNGSYVSRFISSRDVMSMHAFGTASDINAAMTPNLQLAENKALIDLEVGTLLAYNGIRAENGVSYYDFTYSGAYQNARCGVPESVINYLLYELAFYRAGFLWGHYYKSTSDGMHFTLTDVMGTEHGGSGGLRKVFEYID